MIARAAILLLSAAALHAPQAQRAQRAADVRIAVRVVDSASAPVFGADIVVMRGVSDVVARGVTTDAGSAVLFVQRQPGNLQLSVRRIGFQRAYRFFTLPSDDSVSFTIRLSRTVVTLAPVQVTAEEDLKRKSYHLDADDIEKSTRTMLDGTDLFKLRPDMMNSRGGPSACEVPYTPRTGWIESVWVNGARVNLAPVDSVYVASRKPAIGLGTPITRPNPRIQPGRGIPRPMPPAFTVFSHMDTVLSILKTIHPEHIAEVTYHDCFDNSVGKVNSDLAMFIVLKPGIAYSPGRGSYVPPADTTRAAVFRVDSLARYRFRVLGIYDQASGSPLADVDVIDSASGNRVKSTATGTVSLFFVPEGTSSLELRHSGFRDTTVVVNISPADTIPITAVMSRKPENP